MKSMTKNLMAAALLMALPVGASFACTTTAWNGNTGAAAGAEAGGPVPATGGFARYSGACALRTGTGEFVTDNTPGGTGSGTEAIYRARFYVLTSSTGSAKVFSATSADSNGGAEAVGVTYDAGAGSFTFSGVAAPAVTGIVANRWYSVELFHNTAGGSASFTASVAGNNGFTGSSTGTASATAVGSASLGMISGGAGTLTVDEFESTRSADTAIGRLCLGDTNADGVRNVTDAGRIRNEFLAATGGGSNNPTSGQPDVNENGAVTIQDAGLALAFFLGGQAACP
jgi:hypothetical protein